MTVTTETARAWQRRVGTSDEELFEEYTARILDPEAVAAYSADGRLPELRRQQHEATRERAHQFVDRTYVDRLHALIDAQEETPTTTSGGAMDRNSYMLTKENVATLRRALTGRREDVQADPDYADDERAEHLDAIRDALDALDVADYQREQEER